MSEGNVQKAGEGLSDEEMVRQVEGQTSSDLQAEPAFEQESGGTSDDTEASKSAALQGDLEEERPEVHPPE